MSSFKIAGCGQRRVGGAVSEENKTWSAGILGTVFVIFTSTIGCLS